MGIGPPTPTEKLLPFKLARIEKEKVSIGEFTRRYLRGDMDDVGSLGNEFTTSLPSNLKKLANPHADTNRNLF